MTLEVKREVWVPVYEKTCEIDLLLAGDIDQVINEVIQKIKELGVALKKAVENDSIFRRFLGHDSMRPERVNGALDLYKLGLEDVPSDQEDLKECLLRAKAIWWKIYAAISSMQYFVEIEKLKGDIVELDSFFEDGKHAIETAFTAKGGRKVTFEIEPDLKAFIHRGTIANLLLNFARNAAEHGHAKQLFIRVFVDNGCVKINVVDNGFGIINPETRRRKYENEFSGGEGQGLGLASANRRMRTFGGRILCKHTGGINGGVKFILTVAGVAKEISDSEFSQEELFQACRSVLSRNIFEGLVDMLADEPEDLLGHLVGELENAGVTNPEKFLVAKGILEAS